MIINIEYNKPKKLLGLQSAFVSFQYEKEIVDNIRKIKNRYYNATNCSWEIRSVDVKELKDLLGDKHEYVETGEEPNLQAKTNIIYDLPFLKTHLLPHQKEGFQYGMNNEKYMLNDEMGCLDGSAEIEYSLGETIYKTTLADLLNIFKSRDISKEDIYVKCLINGSLRMNKVNDVLFSGVKEVYEIKTKNKSLQATADHEILTTEGYIPVSNLKIDDKVVVEAECHFIKNVVAYEEIISIDYVGEKETYDIKMESPHHNFVANGIVVHNCGKTLQVLALAKARQETCKYCLIICGVNTVKWTWLEQIKQHTDMDAKVIGFALNKKGNIRGGSSKDKIDDLKRGFNEYILITNIETLRNPSINSILKKMCDSGEIGMIAYDEAHKCKNQGAKQSKALLKLNAKYMIAMTGTPLINTPLDLYMPMKWLGYENGNYTAFKNYHCIYGGFGGFSVIGYKNLNELQERFDSISIRRLKKNVLNLPPKIYINEYVEMGSEQTKLYNEIKSFMLENIDKIKLQPNPLAEMLRLRQVTGHTGLLSTKIKVSAKVDRLKELLEEITASGEKAVIFSNWSKMIGIVARTFKKYNPAIITGEQDDNARNSEKERFMTDKECKVIFGTVGAMGVGLTLTAASTVIFLDMPFTYAEYQQCIDRLHRIGTTSSITVVTLIAKDTIDERIYNIVMRKKKMSEAIVDNEYDLNKPETIDFLLS